MSAPQAAALQRVAVQMPPEDYYRAFVDTSKRTLRLMNAGLKTAQKALKDSQADKKVIDGLASGLTFLKGARNVVAVLDAVDVAEDFMNNCSRVKNLFSKVVSSQNATKAEKMEFWSCNFKIVDKVLSLMILPFAILSLATLGNTSIWYLAAHSSGLVADSLDIWREEEFGFDKENLDKWGPCVARLQDYKEKFQLAWKMHVAKLNALRLKIFEDLLNIFCDIFGITLDGKLSPYFLYAAEASASSLALMRFFKEQEAKYPDLR